MCTRGYYGEYVIMAKTREHIKAGLDFARDKNLRLVIRNTGHDFMGRSTGYGALVINTHSFKDVIFVKEYTGPGDWRGGAVTVGAGIQLRELYRLANGQNPPVIVVGGECPVCFHSPPSPFAIILTCGLKTVGFAGGYIQGGGHGPMASFYGMGTSTLVAAVSQGSGAINRPLRQLPTRHYHSRF
jgi:FAD/FMN-containing dehydrogenase